MNICNVGFSLASIELDIRHFCSLPAFCSFGFFRPAFLRLLRSCSWWLETLPQFGNCLPKDTVSHIRTTGLSPL